MNDALAAGLGLPSEVWLFLTVLSSLCLFFKFGRFWSVRNLDLLLLFALTPGLVRLVGRDEQSWWAFVWLFGGTFIWIVRCLIDLGFARRPLLEPNLNSDGLACFVIGLLGLMLVETAIFKEPSHRPRNPGDPHAQEVLQAHPHVPSAALPVAPRIWHNGKRWLAALGHLGIVCGLQMLGWRVFARPAIGLAMAVSYLILPYSRIALLDSGQLIAASLFVLALTVYRRPIAAGALIGVGAAWMPAAFGLIPLWAGFYWGRGAWRFLLVALSILAVTLLATWQWPDVSLWMRALGARRLSEAGLLLNSETPRAGSFWNRVEPAYRLPVFVLYVALVAVVSIWPLRKNLGQLMALSAVLLLATQFWYLDEGGTLVVLYLPMILGVVFRPNLSMIGPVEARPRARADAGLFPIEAGDEVV